MKRPPPTFVVEVRRQRRSTNSSDKAWLAGPAFAGGAAGPGRHPGAAALFEAERKAPPAAATPPSRPQGRILPSLADIAPIASPLEEAPAPSRRKRESLGRAAKPKAPTKKDADREFAPPQRPAPTAVDQTSAPPPPRSFEESSVGWRARGETAAEAAPKAKSSSPRAKSKRKAATPEPRAARALAVAEPAAIAQAPLDNATADRAGARQARHRRILDRYVLGAVLKPGERWKRRLQKARK